MGHVDSGKTSLAKVLSTSLSTAALDKSPASQERGITLDLGFSALQIQSLPTHLIDHPEVLAKQYNTLQFTLVDCPGHASLIRTIIGGSQIIDMMFLVIDIVKGIQTQTAEIPEETRQSKINTMSSKLRKVLENTCFKDSPIVAVAACPASEKSIGLDTLIEQLCSFVKVPVRQDTGSFLFEFDHCFQIKGQGSVMTGTVLRGSVEVNQTVHIPQLNIEKKVKSMQMFHQPIKRAIQGDRAGICVTQLDAKLLERGLLCSPKSVPLLNGAIVAVEKVRFYKNDVKTKSHFHVIAQATFFGNKVNNPGDLAEQMTMASLMEFNSKKEYKYQEVLHPISPEYPVGSQYVLLSFEHPVLCPLNSVIIGSKLDVSLDTSSCRIAFHGQLLEGIDVTNKQLLSDKLKIYKTKTKEGVVDRIHSEDTVLGKNIFSKESDLSPFLGLKVIFDNGIIGTLDAPFGKTGKVRISTNKSSDIPVGTTFKMHLNRLIFDKDKKNKQ
eukprot:gene13683-16118_t